MKRLAILSLIRPGTIPRTDLLNDLLSLGKRARGKTETSIP
jgi:hypothetical protein